MTIYALDLEQVHQTIRATLVERVLPEVRSSSAQAELLSVIEMLDSLQTRLSWEGAALREIVSRTQALATAVGLPAAEVTGDVEGLRAGREQIAGVLATAYNSGANPQIVAAVAEFSAADIRAEISPALRAGLAD